MQKVSLQPRLGFGVLDLMHGFTRLATWSNIILASAGNGETDNMSSLFQAANSEFVDKI